MRAALYIRVSTEKQTTENQKAEVLQLAQARGFDEVEWYRDEESAVKKRPGLERLFDDVRRGRVQAVIVWALDRLHRSMVRMVTDAAELERLGVRLLSVREPWLDVPSEVRPLLLSFFGWVAEMERRNLVARTLAGIERARREGKRLGRAPKEPIDVVKARELLHEQVENARGRHHVGDALHSSYRRSIVEVAGLLGVSETRLRKALVPKEASE